LEIHFQKIILLEYIEKFLNIMSFGLSYDFYLRVELRRIYLISVPRTVRSTMSYFIEKFSLSVIHMPNYHCN